MIDKYKEIYKRIGYNVKMQRKKSKLTQAALAKTTTRLDASKISDIENAKEDFMFSTLLEIANGLNIDIQQLTKIETVTKSKI